MFALPENLFFFLSVVFRHLFVYEASYIVWSGVQYTQFLRVSVSNALDVHLQNELKSWP